MLFSASGVETGSTPQITDAQRTLVAAIPSFTSSSFVAGVLTQDVQDHYAHFYSIEAAAFDAAVTDWERERYFDRI